MTIKWNLTTKNMRPHAQLQSKLQQKIIKVETHLDHFPEDAVQLHVTLERHPKRMWFDAALTLRLPSNILRAQKSAADPVPAFDVDQSETVLGVTESAPSMGSGINAPQPVQGPVSDREGNNR